MNVQSQPMDPEERRAMTQAQAAAIHQYVLLAAGMPIEAIAFGLAIEGEEDLIISVAGDTAAVELLIRAQLLAHRRMTDATDPL